MTAERVITVNGVEVQTTQHAEGRAQERGAPTDLLADLDPRHAVHLGVSRDGLDAVQGRSGWVYMVHMPALVGCRPVRAVVVTVLAWSDVQDGIQAAQAGRERFRWRPSPVRVWPARISRRPRVLRQEACP